MGIQGLSKNVIKQVWRDSSLSALPRGYRIGVDTAGWLHKAVLGNAADICQKRGTIGHHALFMPYVLQLLNAGLMVVLVLDGAHWPLKEAEHKRRSLKRNTQSGSGQRDRYRSGEEYCRPQVR